MSKDKILLSDTNPNTDGINGFSYLNCFYTNADCLTNKLNKLKERISSDNPDIICIVETALQLEQTSDKYCPTEVLEIEGYELFRKDNERDMKGGILVYIKEHISVQSNKVLDNLSADFRESLWLELNISGEKIILGTIYRKGSSGATNNNNLNDLIKKASCLYRKVIICGDFNYPEINWNNFDVDAGPYSSPAKFLNSLNDAFCVQHVKEFTRIRGKDEPSLLDLVITEDSQEMTDTLRHLAPLGKSDHCVLAWKYLVSVKDNEDNEPRPEESVQWNVNKGDYKQLNELINKVDWTAEFKDKSLEESVNVFYEIMNRNIEACVPKKRVSLKKSPKPPWLNKSARKQIRKKKCAWQRYVNSKNYSKYLLYVKERNKCSKKVKKVKMEFEKKLAAECKSNPKVLYRYANFKSKSNKKIIRLKNKDGKICMDPTDNANILNDFFSSVFTVEDDAPELILNQSRKWLYGEDTDDDDIFTYKGKSVDTLLEHCSLDEKMVEDLLSEIDANKSTSPECIHPRILKECSHTLAPVIHHIFKLSLEIGDLPPQWKNGTVTPLHKSGSRHSAENYRPITITSQLCRILEKIIKGAVVNHLESQNVITNDQHGFVKRRSCLTNLLLNLEEITTMIDEGNVVDQIYLDLQKAFDKVPHQRLLYKLQKAGISGHLLAWIESFLSGRQQRVKIKGNYSNWKNVLSGVPQGSVLGPILFIIYINDLPETLKSSLCKVFADDTKITGKANSIEDAQLIQDDLDALLQWCSEWKMKFNSSKCHVVHFGKKNHAHYYHLNGRLLSPVEKEKDLGVIIGKDLKAEWNITHSVAKANKILGMIRRTFSYMDKEMFLQLYKVYVRPHLEYCQQACSPYMAKDINLIEGVQHRATKLVKSIEDLSYEERLKHLKLYSLEDRRLRGDLILMYRIMNGDVNIDSSKLFTVKAPNMARGHAMKVHLKKISNSDIRHNFFTERVIVPWNTLPQHIVESKTVREFKNSYDKWSGLIV